MPCAPLISGHRRICKLVVHTSPCGWRGHIGKVAGRREPYRGRYRIGTGKYDVLLRMVRSYSTPPDVAHIRPTESLDGPAGYAAGEVAPFVVTGALLPRYLNRCMNMDLPKEANIGFLHDVGGEMLSEVLMLGGSP